MVANLRGELVDRMLILGRAQLRTVLADYQAHYNGPRRIKASPGVSPTTNTSLTPRPAHGRSAENSPSTA
jgi:putative transposase